ncbi:putative baseplate assembly protein [Mucilaginibacter agri]|uniref:Baseplate assembly protein n=1 Tax=Mucilaginibacter agri TaxID=2695265 RepID=A0A966DVP8_9SPHI|nr:putative baseplate assembly protein [Mucilaginibacter agri]NCD71696.1 putative baseplate assembly protein [Mucilaginibacter agri]
MTTQIFCKNSDRAKKVRESGTINGIDYLEVATVNQQTLKIYFLSKLPGQLGGVPANPALTQSNVFIEGGVRIKNINVLSVSTNNNVLTVMVDKAGDFSTYTLKIGSSSTNSDTPPDGFDVQLSSIDFSFKINCPNEFDCTTETVCAPPVAEAPEINYLSKDYGSFIRLMQDRLSTLLPDWKERNAADLQVALIELLAYVGDYLSYYQDAVATEAYMETARRRVSLKRHARLLDYSVHDGCNARVWVHVEIEESGNAENIKLDEGTVLLTNDVLGKTAITADERDKLINEQDAVVFETMHSIVLHSAHNTVPFYTWEDNDCCLPKGSTTATLLNEPALFFVKGDVLIFEELYSPKTGLKADADTTHRHVVRLKTVTPANDKLTGKDVLQIEWDEQDALPFSLCISSDIENEDQVIDVHAKSVAHGNVVLADHGMTVKKKSLVPPSYTDDAKYYPQLPAKNITDAVTYNYDLEKSNAASVSIAQDPHLALASVSLSSEQETWYAQHDLLGSDRFATEFVVETEQDGTAYLRFGDDILGKKPVSGFSPDVTYRTGNGSAGNVGQDTINSIEWSIGGITSVRNPLPASGGVDGESMEKIRLYAPQAFRTQERAVTADDYVEKTQLHPEVQKAAAKFYWTGSWYTVYIIIDRKGGEDIDDAFKEEIIQHLEQYRMAGYDLEIKQPLFISLDIILNVCVKPGYFQANVKQKLISVFSSQDLADGSRGFFHPDNFTFGQPVYLSAIYQKAMSVEGVASVEIKKFNRWGKKANSEIQDGLLNVSELEIIRADSSPDFPENGKIDFIMLGGL